MDHLLWFVSFLAEIVRYAAGVKNIEDVLKARQTLDTAEQEALNFLDRVIKMVKENLAAFKPDSDYVYWLDRTRTAGGGTAGCACVAMVPNHSKVSSKLITINVLISANSKGGWKISDADRNYGQDVVDVAEAASWVFEGLEQLFVHERRTGLSAEQLASLRDE
jgi:hypothetical protein